MNVGWIIAIVWASLMVLTLMFFHGARVDDSEVPRAE